MQQQYETQSQKMAHPTPRTRGWLVMPIGFNK